MSDLLTALKGDKIDAFAIDEPVATYVMTDNDEVTYIQDYLDTFEYAYTFPRTESGRKICSQFNEYLRKLKAENILDKKIVKWCSRDESDWVMPDCESLPAPNGILTMAVNPVYPPFAYVYGEKIVGYDIDIAAEFCETDQAFMHVHFRSPKPDLNKDNGNLSVMMVRGIVSDLEYNQVEDSELPNRLVLHIKNDFDKKIP